MSMKFKTHPTVSVATVSVTVCYTAVITIPVCKKVEFMVTNTALTQQNQEKVL